MKNTKLQGVPEEIWPNVGYRGAVLLDDGIFEDIIHFFDKDKKELGYVCYQGGPYEAWVPMCREWSQEFMDGLELEEIQYPPEEGEYIHIFQMSFKVKNNNPRGGGEVTPEELYKGLGQRVQQLRKQESCGVGIQAVCGTCRRTIKQAPAEEPLHELIVISSHGFLRADSDTGIVIDRFYEADPQDVADDDDFKLAVAVDIQEWLNYWGLSPRKTTWV